MPTFTLFPWRFVSHTLLLLLLGLGCSNPQNTPQGGGESHFGNISSFLTACEAEADCPGSDGCFCAVCSVTCGNLGDCATRLLGEGASGDALPDSVVCRAPMCGPGLTDEEQPEASAVCDVECNDHSDCSFLDPSGHRPQICQAGFCRSQEVGTDAGLSDAQAPATVGPCPIGRDFIAGGAESGDSGSSLPDFCLDTTEVTAEQYAACVEAESCVAPTDGNAITAGRESHPIHFVSAEDAEAYCSFAAGRLPTRAQLEFAGRNGVEATAYPWGEEEPSEADVPPRVCAFGLASTCEVEAHPAGATSAGTLGLLGNVAEWAELDGSYCAFGGSFLSTSSAELSLGDCPSDAQPGLDVGFRCASTPSL